MSESAVDFWDHVHRVKWVPSLGETTYDEYVAYLSGVGPFKQELDAADNVLDIGPGFGKFLAGCDARRKCCRAIEISAENRMLLAASGVRSWSPGELAVDTEFSNTVDVATCISVIQHCAPGMVLTLLRDAAAALRPGAALYANGIINQQSKSAFDMENTRGGSHSYTLADIQKMASAAGLMMAGSKQYAHPDINIDVWVARMEKL